MTTLALVSSRREEVAHGLASTNATTLCDHDEDGAKLKSKSLDLSLTCHLQEGTDNSDIEQNMTEKKLAGLTL